MIGMMVNRHSVLLMTDSLMDGQTDRWIVICDSRVAFAEKQDEKS